jgi:hypothetical protein
MGRKAKDPASALEKKINPETVDALRGMSVDELNERLVVLAKNEHEVETFREQDEALAKVVAEKAELEGPYKDQLKEIKATRTFVVRLLEEMGKA